ncbi:MAG: hypothetical protein AMJ95_10805 [Omnitrophica WOR_2 bacterium SM23_72]|nr:MAG: hypothetical protein AMJ95_10805 [Omnitrophica WOR_2 bacterium SM23_72]
MRNLILILVFLFFLASPLSAETLRDQRRLEEEARDDLRFTEPQSPVISEPVLEGSSSIDLSFFQELLSKTYVERGDAIRPVLILLDEEEFMSQDQAAQIRLLRERNILPSKVALDFSPEEPLRKGLLAYMFCQALGIKGGVAARTFGMSQRYAMNELVFTGIMKEGSIDDVVSGEEFIIIFTNAVEYLAQENEAAKDKY